MEINKLRDAAKTIKMPEEMRERIAARTEKALMRERSGVKTKRPAVIAAVIAACICLCAAGAAVGNAGFFRDVTRWDGAVIGTAYEQATEEIAVSVRIDGRCAAGRSDLSRAGPRPLPRDRRAEDRRLEDYR